MKQIRLGVLGGLGPLSTFRFCERLIEHTEARCDQDHIDMIVSSRATTPDRTAFILGASTDDPLPVMLEEAHRLTRAGAELLVIPCNTAHYFYEGLQRECAAPILNIMEETVRYIKTCEIGRVGLLATEGTVASGAYDRYFRAYGIECVTPTDREQAIISSFIYDTVKCNRPQNTRPILDVALRMLEKEKCEKILLGCTELSLMGYESEDFSPFIDAMDILVCRTILACGKRPIGFPTSFSCIEEAPL